MTHDNSYYTRTAYNPAHIPDQPASTERAWWRKLGGSRHSRPSLTSAEQTYKTDPRNDR